MSFRNRLNLFFVLIVVVPMISVGFVLFELIDKSETGKRDARQAAHQQAAIGVIAAARARADRAAVVLAKDPEIAAALRAGDGPRLERRVRQLAIRRRVRRVVVQRPGGGVLVDVGGKKALFPISRELQDSSGTRFGRLVVSSIGPRELLEQALASTDAPGDKPDPQVVVTRGDRVVAASRAEVARADLPRDEKAIVELGGQDYRSVPVQRPLAGFDGALERMWVLDPESRTAAATKNARSVAGLIIGGFFSLALLFALVITRSLQHQIQDFLRAAKRLGDLDFSARVPTAGNDEFALLGREFNAMAEQLHDRLEDLRTERARLQGAIGRIGATFASNLDRDALLQIVVETAIDGTGGDGGRAALRPADGGALRSVATRGWELPGVAAAIQAAEAQVLETGAGAEADLDGAWALAHPLRQGDLDEPTGVVSIARTDRAFTQAERELVAYLAAQAAVSVDNVRLHEQVERQAVTDELTQLHNRRHMDDLLVQEVERAKRFDQPVGVLLLDIDNFKRVNDTHGHQTGDAVLREVARVLRETIREIDEPARYGGEELAAILPGTALEGAFELAERVRRAIEALEVPFADREGTLSVTASFGVATVPASAEDHHDLFAAADAALYEAKRAGKNVVVRAPAREVR